MGWKSVLTARAVKYCNGLWHLCHWRLWKLRPSHEVGSAQRQQKRWWLRISTTSEPPDHSKGCFYSWCFCLCLFFRGGISRMRREMSCRRGTPRTRVGRRHLGMWRSCRTQVQGPQRPRVQVTGKQRQLGRGPQHVTCVSPSLLSKGPPWWPMQHKDGV